MGQSLSGVIRYLGQLTLPKYAILLSLLTVQVMANAESTEIDLAARTGEDRNSAYFLLVPETSVRSRKDNKFLSIKNQAEFFKPENLKKAYEAGPFLLVKVIADSDTQDGWVEVKTPIQYNLNGPVGRVNLKRDKDLLSHCVDFASERKQVCLYDFPKSRNNIPIEAGRIRKILPMSDFLVMTTNLGHLVTCKIFGNYNKGPESILEWGQVPAVNGKELLSQQLTRIYWIDSRRIYVTGVNGSFRGQPLGSKIVSFDGTKRARHAERLEFKALEEDWDYPTFNLADHYEYPNAGRPMFIPLRGYQNGLFSKVPGLKDNENIPADIKTLKKVEK